MREVMRAALNIRSGGRHSYNNYIVRYALGILSIHNGCNAVCIGRGRDLAWWDESEYIEDEVYIRDGSSLVPASEIDRVILDIYRLSDRGSSIGILAYDRTGTELLEDICIVEEWVRDHGD